MQFNNFCNLITFLFLFTIIVVHHSSCEQNSELNAEWKSVSSTESSNVLRNEPSRGIQDVIRNTTNNILHRLENSKDRLVKFIRPAVRSNFSRRVPDALDSLLNRVQIANSSIVRSQFFRNSIVMPFNATVSKLREITGNEKDASQFNVPSSNSSDDSSVLPLIKASEKNEQSDNEVATSENSEQLISEKIKRDSRFMDRNYNTFVTPSRFREFREEKDLFDRIRRQGQRECIASALCQADCRSHLFREQSRLNRLRDIFDTISRSDGFHHNDFDYYLTARRLGRQHYNSLDMNLCKICRSNYPCREEDHEYMLSEYI